MTITELLAPIEARLAAATPGPWVSQRNPHAWRIETKSGDRIFVSIYSTEDVQKTQMGFNREFIANAPTDLTKLIAALKRSDEALEFVERGQENQFSCDLLSEDAKEARADIAALLGNEE